MTSRPRINMPKGPARKRSPDMMKAGIQEGPPVRDAEGAEQKLLELANAIEADHVGRLPVEVINRQFRDAGGSHEEYGAAVKAAIAHGWLTMHPSGGYLSFTQAGADLFA